MQKQTQPKDHSKETPSSVRREMLQSELKRWLPLLIDNLAPDKIVLFGSMAGRHISEWSDIDLVIVHQTDLPFYKRIKKALQIIRPKVGVDLLIYTPDEFSKLSRERRFFRDEILDNGQVLYARS